MRRVESIMKEYTVYKQDVLKGEVQFVPVGTVTAASPARALQIAGYKWTAPVVERKFSNPLEQPHQL